MVDAMQGERLTQRSGSRDWRLVYAAQLAVTDLLVLVWVVFGVQIAWLGWDQSARGFSGSRDDIAVSYTAISLSLILGWMLVLGVYGTRDHRVVGSGPQEYRLITDASVRLFGIVAILAFLFKVDLARGYILMAFPLGMIVLLLTRWIWRQWLAVRRANGQFTSTVLLVGSEISASHIARELSRQPEAGYKVVGACLPTGQIGAYLGDTEIPVYGRLESVPDAVKAAQADTVAITSAEELTPAAIRELSWSLEPGRQHLIVAPSLTGIGGPRIHMRPVAGLPLIHVETPRYGGRKHLSKRVFDVMGSGAMLLALSPLFLILAVLVKVTSDGPVLYEQERVGLKGRHFKMLKFRSMEVDADAKLEELLSGQGRGDQPLFKLENDPRVTSIGKILRKYSLDEFPQLVNVLRGDMSLVGPRPQRDGEVSLYDSAAHRRLLLKPGMSGLWQVSGRSALSWEDSIRLDLYYVENWSLTGDLVILWRTVRAVLSPGSEAH